MIKPQVGKNRKKPTIIKHQQKLRVGKNRKKLTMIKHQQKLRVGKNRKTFYIINSVDDGVAAAVAHG